MALGLGLFGVLLVAAAMIWVIYDVWTNEKSMEQNHKIIWTVAAVFLNVITAIAYYIVVKRK